MEVLIAGFVVYGITLVITMSHIAEKPRQFWRRLHHNTIFGQTDEFDFISCAMCVGFWVSLATCLWHMTLWDTLGAYGISYFLRTLERND